MLGGALVNLGYRLQDRLSHFDFLHDEAITPDQIWTELERQNELAGGCAVSFRAPLDIRSSRFSPAWMGGST